MGGFKLVLWVVFGRFARVAPHKQQDRLLANWPRLLAMGACFIVYRVHFLQMDFTHTHTQQPTVGREKVANKRRLLALAGGSLADQKLTIHSDFALMADGRQILR